MSGFADAQLVDIRPDGILWRTAYDPEVVRQRSQAGRLYIRDGRMISDQQRKNIWALIGEICAHSGYLKAKEKKEVNNALKIRFLTECFDQLTASAIGQFSTGDVDMETAALYQGFLIDFVVSHDIPTRQPLLSYCDDIPAAVYACLMHHKCIICGKKAELHHVDRIGMGGDRRDMCHIGMECLPLCRECHMEAHQHGDRALMDKYHLETIVIDQKIAKEYKLGKYREEADESI
ncbi:MAG: hypothetical protein IKK34_06935 [Clostridia bacterium]|nr:hypothetical protein [Clostridia bacterium]